MMLFSFIIVVSVISYVYDLYYNQNFKDCNSLSFNLLLFIHHLLAITLIFGFLSSSIPFLKFYIYLVITIYLSWFVFKDKCILTVWTNRMCGIQDDVPFESIVSKLLRKLFKSDEKVKSNVEFIIFPSLILLALIRIKILNKKKRVV